MAHGISGWVLNAGDGVHIEASAENPSTLDAFVRALRDEAPVAARIDGIEVVEHAGGADGAGAGAPQGTTAEGSSPTFRIVASDDGTEHTTLVSPDIATCPDCLRELFDPADRSYHYPFINCTNCGPRFTIIRSLPYDRPSTSMDAFPMCPACAAEYAEPADRRFHAQPNACFSCGPHITWREKVQTGTDAWKRRDRITPTVGATRQKSDAIIERCAEMLAAGGIVAIKGLGGFHLACDASNEHAVRDLRRRKRRSNKPLAVMVGNIEGARALCTVDEAEAELLTGSIRPIVLLRRRKQRVPSTGIRDSHGSPSLDGRYLKTRETTAHRCRAGPQAHEPVSTRARTAPRAREHACHEPHCSRARGTRDKRSASRILIVAVTAST